MPADFCGIFKQKIIPRDAFPQTANFLLCYFLRNNDVVKKEEGAVQLKVAKSIFWEVLERFPRTTQIRNNDVLKKVK